nr:putative ribonuclease H-like domain-containing protein [Tanacetum cinerariifolium]
LQRFLQMTIPVLLVRKANNTEPLFYGLKGIKREFSIPRTPQQNGISERKNRTLIEAARTLLVDSLLPIPFCKAFRVFNSRTRIVQETLHVNFMENKSNVTGLQDIEKAKEEGTHTYVLFLVLSNGSTNSQNKNKDALVDGKEHDDDTQKFVSSDIHSSRSGAQTRKQCYKTENKDKGKIPVVNITGIKDLNAEFEECTNNSSNGVNAASSSVSTAGHNFINNTNDFSNNGPSNTAASPTVANSSLQDASTSSHDSDMPNLEDLTHSDDVDDVVLTVGKHSLNNTNTFSAAGPSNTAVSSTYGKSSFIDASQIPDDPDMPELEDITYSDDDDVVGAEADFNNLESSITVSHIPTTRIHKDHPVSQNIGDMSSTTQTRSMTRVVKD